jgi:hypothetical protein
MDNVRILSQISSDMYFVNLACDNKIKAIKVLKTQYDLPLTRAKGLVDALLLNLGVISSDNRERFVEDVIRLLYQQYFSRKEVTYAMYEVSSILTFLTQEEIRFFTINVYNKFVKENRVQGIISVWVKWHISSGTKTFHVRKENDEEGYYWYTIFVTQERLVHILNGRSSLFS